MTWTERIAAPFWRLTGWLFRMPPDARDAEIEELRGEVVRLRTRLAAFRAARVVEPSAHELLSGARASADEPGLPPALRLPKWTVRDVFEGETLEKALERERRERDGLLVWLY